MGKLKEALDAVASKVTGDEDKLSTTLRRWYNFKDNQYEVATGRITGATFSLVAYKYDPSFAVGPERLVVIVTTPDTELGKRFDTDFGNKDDEGLIGKIPGK